MAPRLRRDLVATTVEEQGVTCVEVTDPLTATSFRFYDFEYALAQQLMGQPLAEVAGWASSTYGVELSSENLDDFVEKLAGLGFLTGTGPTWPSAVLGAPVVAAPVETISDGGHGAEIPPSVTESSSFSPAPPSAEGPPVDNAATDSPSGGAASAVGPADHDARDFRASPSNRDIDQLLPGLQILAGPLPPVIGAEGGNDDAGAQVATSVASVTAPQVAPQVEPRATPLSAPSASSASSASSAPSAVAASATAVASGPPDAHVQPYPPARPDAVASPPVPTPAVPERYGPPEPQQPQAKDDGASRPSPPPSAVGPPARRPPVDLPPSPSPSPSPSRLPSVVPPRKGDDAWQAQTPLASVANFIVSEASNYAPSGALDVGNFSTAVAAGRGESSPAAPSSPSSPLLSPPPSASPPRWAADLADGFEGAPREAPRQAARPQVVVMPPVAAVSAPAAGPVRTTHRRSSVFFVLLLLGAIGGGAAWFLRPTGGPDSGESPAAVVHIVSPQPTTFYRWFDAVGTVVAGRDETLSFRTGGKLQDAMPPGTTFSAGETIARLQGVAARELVVNQLRSRVAFFEQLRDSRRAEGAEAAARQAELKLGARRQELANAQTSLADLEIRPKVAGQVAELLATKGAIIKPGAVVFRVRAAGPRATFNLPQPDAARARALGFCRVETIVGTGGGVDGATAEASTRPIDCSLSASTAEDQGQLAVDLVGAAALPAGTQVRLASARYDGVFPIPRAAIGHEGATDRLWIAAGADTKVAENRDVEVVATLDDLSLVSRGISVGDAIIIDPPASLQSGATVTVAR